ncbi:MAG TPA: LCP family protein, partial [Candidatus Paceibacterota bacterium]|nr:LCP family protein [Candidatus Paceibacterota bacterium]
DELTPIIYSKFPQKGKFNNKVLAGVFIFVAVIIGIFTYQSRTRSSQDDQKATINQNHEKVTKVLPKGADDVWETQYIMPAPEKDRLDVLVLGIRGKDDPDGGLLTDSIMILSYNKTTKKSALVSVPRDLYVRLNDNTEDKINAAYEFLGLAGTKKLFSRITGVYVDNIIVVDFSSFKEIVDDLGGIDVVLKEPFSEPSQWGYPFFLPAGPNHLNGQSALYYVRSRYSTDDFDRARRQQEVILAIKKKITETNFLSDPTKAIALLSAAKRNIQTDFNILDVPSLIELAQELNVSSATMKQNVISTTNLLYDSRKDNVYVLLPIGDNLSKIKKYFRNILASSLPGGTATPTPH